ncbi:MAG: hypothetical protein GX786_02045, partial [Clostridiales bacterium]|nr:hypothetical protein [Clostridiales bacterium]
MNYPVDFYEGGYYDYEPSELEEKALEFKEFLEESIKKEHKDKIDSLTKENVRLKAIESEMNKTTQENRKLERELKWKMENYAQEYEKEFEKKNIEDVMQEFFSNETVWFGESLYKRLPKCELCNEERILEHTFPNGQKATVPCDCNDGYFKYEPVEAKIKYLTIGKSLHPTNYRKKFYFSITRDYEPKKD